MSDDTLVDFGLSSESALAEWWKGKLMMYETGSVAFLPQRAPYLLWSKTYTSNIQKTISNFPCSLKSHKDPSEGVQASGFFYHRALNIWPFSEVSEVSESHCWRQAHSWAQRAGGLREGAPLHCHRWLKTKFYHFSSFLYSTGSTLSLSFFTRQPRGCTNRFGPKYTRLVYRTALLGRQARTWAPTIIQ